MVKKLCFFSPSGTKRRETNETPLRRLFPGGKQKEGRNSPSGTFSSLEEGRRETNETEANEPEEENKRKSPLRGVKLQEIKSRQKEGRKNEPKEEEKYLFYIVYKYR